MTRDELIAAVRRVFQRATAVRTAARGTLAGTKGITEKRMFGGVAFFLHGNMVAGTASMTEMGGALLLRVGKDGEAAALAEPHTRPMVMAGRRMGGYIYVDAAGLTGTGTPIDDAALARWLRRAIAYVETLPRKKTGSQKKAAKARCGAGPRTERQKSP